MFLGGCIAFGFTIMAQIKDVSPIIQTDKFATTTASTDTIAILKLEDSNTQQIVKEIQKTNLLLADIDNVLRHKK